jgi:hypothetical protein
MRMKAITPKMLRVIAALLSGKTLEQAAQEVGCSYRTARRWKATPEFQRALRTAREKVLEEIADLFLAMGKRAAVVAYECMGDESPPTVRVRAMEHVTECIKEFTGLANMRAELDELWAALGGKHGKPVFTRNGYASH